MRSIFSLMLLASSATLLMGCSGGPSDMPDVAEVSGTITLDGQPLADAEVMFQPAEGRPSSGTTDASGKYDLIYSPSAMGAKLGAHKVSIIKSDESDPENPISLISGRYNTETELKAEVATGANVFDFKLESGE